MRDSTKHTLPVYLPPLAAPGHSANGCSMQHLSTRRPSAPTRSSHAHRAAHRSVAVVDAADELLEKVARLVLAEAPRLDDAVEELAAGGVLHHDAEVRRGEEDLGGLGGGGEGCGGWG
jgi:hypothetical protein